MPRRRGDRHLRHANGKPIPALHAYSESVIPRPSDWPDTATVTGYWFLDRLEEWQPPAELEEFLGAGEPPIYFGFGSIFGRDPLRLTRIVVDAVKATGVRAIIARGWGGLETTELELPETVLAIDSAPHDWLFPKVAAVVHHGGAARRRQVCVPEGQPSFARSLEINHSGAPGLRLSVSAPGRYLRRRSASRS